MKLRAYYCLVIVLFITLLINCKSNDNDKKIYPVYKDISELVYASAKVVSHDTYQSRPSRSGIIEDIYVKEGDAVTKEESLFRIKATADSKNKLNNALVNKGEAEEYLLGKNGKLKSLKLQIQQIKQQNKLDSINYQRQNRLWEQNIGSKNQLEKTLLSYQSSSNQLESMLLELEQTNVLLQNNFNKARYQVNTEQSLLGDLEIVSQINGIILSLNKEIGEYISPQETFASIGSNDDFVININIDEVDITRIEIGDTAIIELEAYPNEVYISVLNYIAKTKDESTQTFKVEANFINNPEKLFNGLSGEANILVAKRKNAIVIPSQYLLNRNKVLTENGSIEVSVGVKNIEFVEILEGIDTSTQLIKPDNQ